MKVLLTGASSYVGARLYFDLSKKFEVTGTYFGNRLSKNFVKLDTTNKKEIEKIIDNNRPEIIIHAAANANARWCEANPDLAILLNQKSTEIIVGAASKISAKVILISSFAAKNPVNVYGRTKFESEKAVQQSKAGFIVIRPSLIIGFSPNIINDRPFNRLLRNIDEKTDAIYDTSWEFQPSYIGHISEVIEQVIKRNILNEIIPVAVAGLKTRYDIARDILGVFNIKVMPVDKNDKTLVITDDLNELKKLNLSQYSYKEIIGKCIEEIKNRQIFKFAYSILLCSAIL
ncbi:MAG: NAD(P)-dependent oxidoreductase [Candidatus Levybacteria bacterium]|nr:NAD(P)-dependent oxidoreductase [Candidatus Levybacteria bacterium]